MINQNANQMQSTLNPTATPTKTDTRAGSRFTRRTRGDSPLKRLLIHAALIAYCIITIYPISRVIGVSLRPGDKLLTSDLSPIPADASLSSYDTVLNHRPFYEWIFNSLLITLTVMVIGVVLAATSAYAFSRFRFVGRGPGLVFLLANQMIPATMLVLPIFLMLSRLGLTQQYTGIIFAYSVSAVPFSVWILKGYYDTIPKDLEEAAQVDGATQLGAFWRVIVPLSTPALAIAALFNFTQAWNEYLLASLIFNHNDRITNQQISTWPVGLNTMLGQFTSEWGNFAAASVMVSIPVMVLFLYSSKWLIGGLTLGGVKG